MLTVTITISQNELAKLRQNDDDTLTTIVRRIVSAADMQASGRRGEIQSAVAAMQAIAERKANAHS